MTISLPSYLATFSDSFIFGEATSSQLFRVTTSTQQLLFWSSCFFRTATLFGELLFQNSHFFRNSYFFQNSYFFRAELLPSCHFLRIGSSLGQLLFRTATFLVEELFRTKISTEELLFRSRYFCTASTFQKSYILEKANFSKKQYSTLPTFFYNIIFQYSNYFTDVLSFRRYISYLLVSN